MDLQYYKTFKEDTSQGIVGLLKPVTFSRGPKIEEGSKVAKCHNKKVFKLEKPESLTALNYFFVKDTPAYPIYVFKIPKEVNTLIDHEFKISQDMEELCSYLPHFNKVLEVKKNVKCHIPNCSIKTTFNPFTNYNCIRDVALVEYIPSSLTLLEYLKGTNFSYMESLIHQLILALFIAQQEKNFTHYDLHLENILIRRCLKRTFFWYKFLYEGTTINRLVYTNGHFPVLFDYGFAYSKGLEGTSYTNSLFFTNKGYTPFMFDEVNDFKTLMIRLAYVRNCPSKIRDLVNKKFLKVEKSKNKRKSNCTIDLETGWNKTTVSSIARIVCKRLNRIITELRPTDYRDNFIYRELDNLIDLFGILIKLPIGQNDFKVETLKDTVRIFLTEWEKIDNWFDNNHGVDEKLNIMKRLIETINEILDTQLQTETDDNQNCLSIVDIEHKFKLEMFKILDAFGDFIYIENFNYGEFLSSIIQISNYIEHVVYIEIQRYKKLFNFNTNGWDLFTSIENIVDATEPYKFKFEDNIVLFDCVEKSTSSFELKDKSILEALNISPDVKSQLTLLNNLQMKDNN